VTSALTNDTRSPKPLAAAFSDAVAIASSLESTPMASVHPPAAALSAKPPLSYDARMVRVTFNQQQPRLKVIDRGGRAGV
jgi:hypothetical protein